MKKLLFLFALLFFALQSTSQAVTVKRNNTSSTSGTALTDDSVVSSHIVDNTITGDDVSGTFTATLGSITASVVTATGSLTVGNGQGTASANFHGSSTLSTDALAIWEDSAGRNFGIVWNSGHWTLGTDTIGAGSETVTVAGGVRVTGTFTAPTQAGANFINDGNTIYRSGTGSTFAINDNSTDTVTINNVEVRKIEGLFDSVGSASYHSLDANWKHIWDSGTLTAGELGTGTIIRAVTFIDLDNANATELRGEINSNGTNTLVWFNSLTNQGYYHTAEVVNLGSTTYHFIQDGFMSQHRTGNATVDGTYTTTIDTDSTFSWSTLARAPGGSAEGTLTINYLEILRPQK